MEPENSSAPKPRRPWARFIPLAVLLTGLVAFFALGLDQYVGCDALRDHRAWLLQHVHASFLISTLVFLVGYITVIAFSLPGGAIMTVTGGFLFGQWLGTAYVVVAATVGATILFLAARSALADWLRVRAGPFLKRMEKGFQDNALNYLLVLRLIPLFPFFVVNLVPAFLGVSLRDYVAATFIGIIPGSFVYASVGAGLGSIFDAGGTCTLTGVFTPEIITALIGLAILALLPVAYKRYRGRRG